MKKVTLRGDEQVRFMNELLDNAIRPHAGLIAGICGRGEIACVVFDPGEDTAAGARCLGWDGLAPVFRLSKAKRREMVATMKALYPGDKATVRFLEGNRPGRIFFMVHDGSLLLNHDCGRGFYLEPGSDDGSWLC